MSELKSERSSLAPYSFSKLSTFQQCNRKFQYKYVTKIPNGPVDKTALFKGSALHNILEVYPLKSTYKLASQYQHIADEFIKSDTGQRYLTVPSTREYKFGLKWDLTKCSFWDKGAMFRGSVDYVGVDGGTVIVVDWKSGKYKDVQYQNFDQLVFYAVFFFMTYPNVRNVKISYVYIEHQLENTITLTRDSLPMYVDTLMGLVERVDRAVDFPKTETKLCEWCPFQQTCSKS